MKLLVSSHDTILSLTFYKVKFVISVHFLVLLPESKRFKLFLKPVDISTGFTY